MREAKPDVVLVFVDALGANPDGLALAGERPGDRGALTPLKLNVALRGMMRAAHSRAAAHSRPEAASCGIGCGPGAARIVAVHALISSSFVGSLTTQYS